ncbi:hypothetical protein EAH89_26270 [Roseomonas nepalensis]|uniref:Uncharacterized protein n=1 Tax=Muricoccus nepalensis TaxID=1854500 RepID=A0A502F8M4_9PROT|nr:hypothetical protein EAH89_26270 [Roseomonas nepalensis]
MDLRSREARLLRRFRAELTEHVGGSPSVTQRALIERACWLNLHLVKLDRKATEGDTTALPDSGRYLELSRGLCDALRMLGLTPHEHKAAPATDEAVPTPAPASTSTKGITP